MSVAQSCTLTCGRGSGRARRRLPEALPCQTRPVASSSQPLEPASFGGSHETGDAGEVAVDSEVVDVSVHASAERGVLLFDRLVPLAPAEVVDGLLRPLEASPCGFWKFCAQCPLRVLRQNSVNPRKSKFPGPFPPCCCRGGRLKGTSRVFSGCRRRPNLAIRLRSSCLTSSASSCRSNPMTKSSAYLTRQACLSAAA